MQENNENKSQQLEQEPAITSEDALRGDNAVQIEESTNSMSGLAKKFKGAMQDPKKRIILLSLFVFQAIVILYFLISFFSDDKSKKSETTSSRQARQSDSHRDDFLPSENPYDKDFQPGGGIGEPSNISDYLKVKDEPKAPLPPMPPAPLQHIEPAPLPEQYYDDEKSVAMNEPNLPSSIGNSEEEERRKELLNQRMKASSIVFGGGGPDGVGLTKEKPQKGSGFLGFDGGVIENDDELAISSENRVIATKVANLHRTIIQGKIIDGVMESAINTTIDTPGTIRAIVSRDVYAEQGRNILIPKGSRIVGTYGTDGKGNTRLMATWDRVITPKGIDVNIASNSVDELGRMGIIGKGDDKIINKLLSAFLVSYMIPYTAYRATGADKDEEKSNTTSGQQTVSIPDGVDENGKMKFKSVVIDGGNSGTTRQQMVKDATNKFTDIGNEAIENRFPAKTIISVPQGTAIRIFVAKDVVFPTSAIERRSKN